MTATPHPRRATLIALAAAGGLLAGGLTAAGPAAPGAAAAPLGSTLAPLGSTLAPLGSALAPLAAPEKVKAKVASNLGKALAISWNQPARAASYRVFVALEKSMKSKVHTSERIKRSSLTLKTSKIPWGSTVYVKVRAYTAAGKALTTSAALKVKTKKADPLRLAADSAAAKKVHVDWKSAKNTTKYQVTAATDAKMEHIVYSKRKSVSEAWISGKAIGENAKLYIRVRTLDRPRPVASAKIKARAGVKTPKAPGNVKATPSSASSLSVTWSGSSLATRYWVALAATPTGNPVWQTKAGAGARSKLLTGLAPAELGLGRVFFVRVTADRMGRATTSASPVSAALPFPVPGGAAAFAANVGSYNVLREQDEDAKGRTFYERVGLLAARISDLDIVGVQETTYAVRDGARPIFALEEASGLELARIPLAPGSTAAAPAATAVCARHSDHILYRAARFKVVACGEDYLNAYGGFSRYLAWAVMEETASGTQFLMASTHLTAGAGATRNQVRLNEVALMAKLITQHNPAGYPVIITADLNADAVEFPRTPPVALAASGYLGADVTAPATSRLSAGTYHGFSSAARTANRIDYVMGSAKVVAESFAVRWAAPASEPSDHFPVRATLRVYR
ncbi:MAG: hypothetical protein LBT54_07790 [Bifidobacteriaceae bacterium]|jgi:endonuclease/exonuclease/phosphatase family metal-dependent hydrolase|nr:hypothetical protein [Bifidobacteriaceae bacterium]